MKHEELNDAAICGYQQQVLGAQHVVSQYHTSPSAWFYSVPPVPPTELAFPEASKTHSAWYSSTLATLLYVVAWRTNSSRVSPRASLDRN